MTRDDIKEAVQRCHCDTVVAHAFRSALGIEAAAPGNAVSIESVRRVQERGEDYATKAREIDFARMMAQRYGALDRV